MSEEEKITESEDTEPVVTESDSIHYIRAQFPDLIQEVSNTFGEETIVVSQVNLIKFMTFLRDDPSFLYN